ncbi:MAG: hypothetical protein DBX62_05130 [Clostridia bacterium]|jgi:hypothetical protein|nr:MAG: hypothetical protein DBX62_05130 [Clostridia bacterium]DAZ27321.1 MAG TPA: hypothetical protein [Caudoviricetes sp.]
MFVVSKRNIIIPSPDGSQAFRLPKDFMGDVPAWVSDSPYFKGLVSDGKIIVSNSKSDKSLEASAKAAAEAEAKAKSGGKGRGKKSKDVVKTSDEDKDSDQETPENTADGSEKETGDPEQENSGNDQAE